MIYNTVEQDASEAITEYKEKPTWSETLSAATKNFTSASLSTSEFNYYNDERLTQMDEWKKNDAANTLLYDRVGGIPKQVVEKLESLYEDGNIDAIKSWNSMGTGDEFLAFKNIQKEKGIVGPKEIIDIAKDKSFADFEDSKKILNESDYTSAKLLGTMGGALQDPITLATLPIGSWKTGGSILWNAARAFGEEAAIEASAQAVILPVTYAYKQEIGIKTTLKDEAYNAVASIATAGLIRGTGSAAFDLTAKGIKALKAKDPQLGAEYERMANSQATDNLDEHINNLHKAEFNEEAELTISNPNEIGVELSKAKPISEVSDDVMEAARGEKTTTKTLAAEVKPDPRELKIYSGEDEAGNPVYKSHRELAEEADTDAMWIQKAKDCFL